MGMPSRRTNNFPESGRGLGRVTTTIFGSTVGYPSDSLASCISSLGFYCICLSVCYCVLCPVYLYSVSLSVANKLHHYFACCSKYALVIADCYFINLKLCHVSLDRVLLPGDVSLSAQK